MGLINLLSSDPLAFLIVAAALLLSLAFHEFAHAWTADRLGDPTPRRFGRVTLNPINHLDPIGSLLLLFAPFGFARPVPINPNNLGRWGTLWTAAAGPLSNLLIALVCVGIIAVVPRETLLAGGTLATFLFTVLSVNLGLAIFNLLPIPLLDGSRIVGGLVPSLGRSLSQFEAQPFSFLIVMVFIFLFSDQLGQLIATIRNGLLSVVL
ncbi:MULTISPECIES: site-2 protease family protein [unclassified Deinococcus]|uniref:site-2 protease family protein n=1 Tax=unclassified Deinococcus TaxID=2623546 RepID=UPI001C2FD1BB|nr:MULTISPECIES: site-2 protease family protein [unclassified Deinococcus]MDK2010922.1 site-2 protease family protein [Deinococcus sp. 43]